MRLGRLLIFLAIVVILGIGAILLFLNVFTSGGGEENGGGGGDEVTLFQIVIVEQPIARGQVISPDALGLIPFPQDEAVVGMFTDPSQVEGLRARFDLSPGVPLTEGMVVSSIEELSEIGSDASLLIPRGMVAISVPLNRFSSVAYGLQRGDHINLITTMLVIDLDQQFQTPLPNVTGGFIAPGPQVVTFSESEESTTGSIASDPLINNLAAQSTTGGDFSLQGRAEVDPILNQPLYLVPSEPDQRPRLVSQTLLQDIVVLNVGEFPRVDTEGNIVDETQQQQQDGQAADGTEGEAAQPVVAPRPDIVTLIVTPQDAVTLNYLLYAGAELNMVLRPSGDDTRVFTEAVTLQFLLDQYNIPVPPKVAFGLEPGVDSLNLPGSSSDTQEETQ